jgi:alkylation response protein AidB-like acyl-CoA dehydrogenase
MRWALDPEQEMLVEALADWLGDAAEPAVVRGWLDSGNPSAFEHELVEGGWLGIGVDDALGGQGGGLIDLAVVAEQFARHAVPSSAWLATVVALPALAANDDLLAGVLERGEFAALVVAADTVISSAPAATLDGDRLTGSVASVLGADRATVLVVAVAAPGGTELWAVRTDAGGVTLTPRNLLDRTRSAADVSLDGSPGIRLEVDADAVLAVAALRSAVLIAADALGAASRMLELAVEYSKQRKQYGAAVGSFQAMKHAAATMLVDEEASRSIVYYAAATVETGEAESALHAATAKSQATAAGARTADGSLAMHGAIGYTWEHDLQLLYKRAMLDVPLWGDPAAWNERIAGLLELAIPAAH